MILGIDASNIRSGGGVTHLVELLGAAEPETRGFSRIIVWARQATLSRIADRPWLEKIHVPLLERSIPWRLYWQRFKLSNCAELAGCDVLFVPGGSFSGGFRPFVAMSQNLLPFESREMARYGFSYTFFRCLLLRCSQSRTFRKADGLVLLTDYARKAVMRLTGETKGGIAVIPHGVDERFIQPPKKQSEIGEYSFENPFRILYVSIVDVYKHQWRVAEAVARLRSSGLPVTLELAGPAYGPAFERLQKALGRLDAKREFITYLGEYPHNELQMLYGRADLAVFASSCENLPIILLECMAAGLPIACSSRGPMPEVLGDAGEYFDPEKPAGIADALARLIADPALRSSKSLQAFAKAKTYSWTHCAGRTLGFLAETARAFKSN